MTDTSASRGSARERRDERRACAYCQNPAAPGLRHHLGWPVCPDHETPERLMNDSIPIDDLDAAERLELDRLRKFIRRLGYVRSAMAAGDQAILDALIDERHLRVLAALDKS